MLKILNYRMLLNYRNDRLATPQSSQTSRSARANAAAARTIIERSIFLKKVFNIEL